MRFEAGSNFGGAKAAPLILFLSNISSCIFYKTKLQVVVDHVCCFLGLRFKSREIYPLRNPIQPISIADGFGVTSPKPTTGRDRYRAKKVSIESSSGLHKTQPAHPIAISQVSYYYKSY